LGCAEVPKNYLAAFVPTARRNLNKLRTLIPALSASLPLNAQLLRFGPAKRWFSRITVIGEKP
jgi:hypothetical protein